MFNSNYQAALFGYGFAGIPLHLEVIAGILFSIIFILFLVLERRFPYQKCTAQHLRRSYKTNLSLFIFNSAALSLLSTSALLALAERHSSTWLLEYVSSPDWQLLMSFLLFDLSLYAWHVASHHFDFLWQFHRVHHSDRIINVSTAFRLHLLDIIVMTLVKAAYIVVFGFDKQVVLVNEIANTIFLMFHHSNLKFKGEHLLGFLIIVPQLHRSHHSTERHEHDNNYGAILSIWDRLFGTLVELAPIQVGIKATAPEDLLGLIKFGFSSKFSVPAQKINSEMLERMIAEAAYYKSEKRNFHPGHEIRDWLEAKREILKQVYGNKSTGDMAQNATFGLSKLRLCC
jgi:sterol desaturase/sphingolipid hydroxylase (fatty acid hydroxylase superfamily)